MRTAISAAIIQDQKILLVKKDLTWILPGGKPEGGETELECLCREIDEELSGTKINDIQFYKSFEGIAPRKGYQLRVKVYLANIDEQLYEVCERDSISEAAWADNFANYTLSDTTYKIVKTLEQDKYL